MRLWSSAPILQALPCTVPYLQPFIVCLSAASEPERRFGSPMLPSVLEHALTIVCFCGIILAQELVLLSMIVGATQLYHRRTFSCFLFVTHVLYLNKNEIKSRFQRDFYRFVPWKRPIVIFFDSSVVRRMKMIMLCFVSFEVSICFIKRSNVYFLL